MQSEEPEGQRGIEGASSFEGQVQLKLQAASISNEYALFSLSYVETARPKWGRVPNWEGRGLADQQMAEVGVAHGLEEGVVGGVLDGLHTGGAGGGDVVFAVVDEEDFGGGDG